MSAEAIEHVITHSDTKGTYRAIMLALAIRCRKKKKPYLLRISCRDLAVDVNISPKWALDALSMLCFKHELERLVAGRGRQPSLYEIKCPVVAGTTRRYAQIRWFAQQRKKKSAPLGIPEPN